MFEPDNDDYKHCSEMSADQLTTLFRDNLIGKPEDYTGFAQLFEGKYIIRGTEVEVFVREWDGDLDICKFYSDNTKDFEFVQNLIRLSIIK